jgi:hypothetical protein
MSDAAPGMTCEICGATATVHLCECSVVAGRPSKTQTKERHLCESCAVAEGLHVQPKEIALEDIDSLPDVPESLFAIEGKTFTSRACGIMGLAGQDAMRRRHKGVGAEHILFAVLRLGTGTGVEALCRCGTDLYALRIDLETTLNATSPEPSGRRIIEKAMSEASSFGQEWVGSEHMVLALCRETQGVLADHLRRLNVQAADVRKAIQDLQDRPAQ